jgi:succinylglutamate desuccinylase
MDMNRLFGVENMNLGDEKVMNEYASEKYSKMKYEESRAIEIARVLAECSYLLDIHSTIKPSIPFVYSEADDDHMALASLMGTKFAVSPDAHFRPLDLVSSADNYVDRAGGTGITYESGWHKDELAVDETLFRAKLFLQKTGACNFGLHEPENTTEVQQLLIYDHVVPQTTSFIFARDFSNFDTVATGEIIGSDGGREISAQRDCSIIFPKKVIQQGRAACYLAYAH